MVAQPTHVVGRSINSSGEVTKELVSDFTYLEDGKLSRYEFPEYAITANFYYTGDYLTEETVLHNGGYHSAFERNRFEYENGQIRMVSHLTDNMGPDQYWLYSYRSDGRLERIDYRENVGDYHTHWLYDYQDNGHTVVESYYNTSGLNPDWLLRERKTSQFDEDYKLSCVIVEKYDLSGALTSTDRTNYGYTESGLLSECTNQTLDDETWVNASITRYVRDDVGSLVEKLDGAWDAETAEWNYSHKITFETSENGQTYLVSLYKRSGDAWVWDVFNGQTVLFGDILKPQQRMLTYMAYEEGFGEGNINQLEFSLEWMKEPVYLDVESTADVSVRAYPNPVGDALRLEYSPDVTPTAVELYDAQGRLLTIQRGNLESVNTGSLPAGLYTVKVTLDNGKSYSDTVIKK